MNAALRHHSSTSFDQVELLSSVRELFIEQHLVAAQPTGTKMLNSYFSAPIVL